MSLVTNAESGRILAVLDETMRDLQVLSYVNSSFVERIEDFKDTFSADFLSQLEKSKVIDSELDFEKDKASTSPAVEMCRIVNKNPDVLRKVRSLGLGQSASILKLVEALKRLQQGTEKRLSVTVEEENSKRSHFTEVMSREEKASKEKLSLEQQLRIERRERQKALAQLKETEVRTKNELQVVRDGMDKFMKSLIDRTEDTANRDAKQYNFDYEILLQEITKLEAHLETLQESNRDAEAKLVKKKNKSEEEVETWIQEYDKDMAIKEKAYQNEMSVYKDVVKQLESYEGHYNKLRKEIEDANERELEDKKVKDEAERSQKKQDEAAAFIQNIWKQHKLMRDAASPKGKGKGKGK